MTVPGLSTIRADVGSAPGGGVAGEDERWFSAAIGLGASMGDRLSTLRLAVRALDARPDLHLIRSSRVLATPPIGGVASQGFLNAVIRVETSLSPRALLDVLKEMERRLGRRPARSWADRVLDLDVLLFDRRIHADAVLRIPHPRLAERDFYLQSLAEAWPDAPNPWTGLPWAATLPPRRRYPVVATLPAARP
jgi:2-amino-4-hydroxy-6-hydroxymethyldihydropteridine diphosphokinase